MRAAANHFVAGTLAWLVVVNCYGDGGVVHADNVLVRPWGENALRVQVSSSSWTLTDALPTAYLPGGAPGDGFFTFGLAGHDVAGGPVTSGNIMAAQGEAQGEMWADREMGCRVRGWGEGNRSGSRMRHDNRQDRMHPPFSCRRRRRRHRAFILSNNSVQTSPPRPFPSPRPLQKLTTRHPSTNRNFLILFWPDQILALKGIEL